MTQKRRASERKKADYLFSKFIRARDKRCQECGTTEGLQCAHLISRSYAIIRHDPLNAVALCVGCHKRFTHRPLEWDEWIRNRIGDEEYANLRARARAGGKVDYRNVLGWLKEAV